MNQNARKNARAFPRYPARSSVHVRFESSYDVLSASVKDYSKGGIGFISRNQMPENTLIQIARPVSESFESAPLHSSRVKILWSRKRSKNHQPFYESGGKWTSLTCDWCNKRVDFNQLKKTDEAMFLCSECIDELDSHLGGRLKDTVHEYLLGNVV